MVTLTCLYILWQLRNAELSPHHDATVQKCSIRREQGKTRRSLSFISCRRFLAHKVCITSVATCAIGMLLSRPVLHFDTAVMVSSKQFAHVQLLFSQLEHKCKAKILCTFISSTTAISVVIEQSIQKCSYFIEVIYIYTHCYVVKTNCLSIAQTAKMVQDIQILWLFIRHTSQD